MKKVKLTQRKYALIDNDDFEKIIDHYNKWFAIYDKNTKGFYACSWIKTKNGKRKPLRMHRFIMNCPKNMQIDHINHNTLDNRKSNLRICTNSENSKNKKTKFGTSKYKGVSWKKSCNQWVSQLCINGKVNHIGLFKNEKDAAKSYDLEAKKYFGDFAYLNF